MTPEEVRSKVAKLWVYTNSLTSILKELEETPGDLELQANLGEILDALIATLGEFRRELPHQFQPKET